jgi:hypothetical protein
MMFSGLEKLLTSWFGSATAVGAVSWLQELTWIAAVIGAIVAILALRRNSLQARATLLLNLHRTWEGLATDRQVLGEFVRAVKHDVLHRHADLKEQHQAEHLRDEFLAKLVELREAKDPKFRKFVEYIAFFELVGMYVKNGYIPLRDAMQMYKGPILDVEMVWLRFAKRWAQEAHMPPGLFEHAIFLMKATRTRSKHPIFYWTLYRFRRFFRL